MENLLFLWSYLVEYAHNDLISDFSIFQMVINIFIQQSVHLHALNLSVRLSDKTRVIMGVSDWRETVRVFTSEV